MEELHSTEILEREILEDARKKAQRILKNADDTINAKTAEWEKKTAEFIDNLKKKFDEQKEQTNEKVMARLGIDKLRAKAEKIENLLKQAIEDWYKSLEKTRILEILTKELSIRLVHCEDISACAKKNIYYSGLEQQDTEAIIKSIEKIAAIKWTELKQVQPVSHYPMIILETENLRVIASIKNSIDYFLLEKREELVEALVGRESMETV